MEHLTALHRIADQQGVFLRREALEHGLDDKALRRALGAGELVRVRHGAYVFADQWTRATDVDQLLLRTRAVVRVTCGPVALSHHSAAALHGLDLWDVDFDTAHVTRLDRAAGRTERGAVHHEGFCVDDDLVAVDGLTVVRPVRAALESALLSGVERGLATVDSGLRRGLFTSADLSAQHQLMQSWSGSQHLHLVTRLADGRSESVGETRTRYVCWFHGLPAPELQFRVVHDGRLVGITDFAWPEHRLFGEFDGAVKYGRLLRAGEDPGDAVFREKKREDLIRQVTGWRFVRFTWSDLYHPEQVAATIRSMMRSAA